MKYFYRSSTFHIFPFSRISKRQKREGKAMVMCLHAYFKEKKKSGKKYPDPELDSNRILVSPKRWGNVC